MVEIAELGLGLAEPGLMKSAMYLVALLIITGYMLYFPRYRTWTGFQ